MGGGGGGGKYAAQVQLVLKSPGKIGLKRSTHFSE